MIESSVIIETINRWNEDSLRLIYTHHYKLLMAYAIQLLGERTEAEDAVQDVLLNTWEQRNAYETERHLRTYLFNAVRNRCLTILNHLNVTVSHQERLRREYREMALEDHSIALHKEEVYRQLFLAIDQMPSKQRKIFLLAIEGKRNSEIAEISETNINTVKALKRRGIARLRATLQPDALLLLALLLE